MPTDYRQLQWQEVDRALDGSDVEAVRSDIIRVVEARRSSLGLGPSSTTLRLANRLLEHTGVFLQYIQGDAEDRGDAIRDASVLPPVERLVMATLRHAGIKRSEPTHETLGSATYAVAEMLLADQEAAHHLRAYANDGNGIYDIPTNPFEDSMDAAQRAMRTSLRAENQLYGAIESLGGRLDGPSQMNDRSL